MEKTVFLLWHVHQVAGEEDDEKLVGVYSSEDQARAAIERVRQQPGLMDEPDHFHIDMYEINRDYWAEGYISV